MGGVWVQFGNWIKVKLVPNWKSAWKWFSVQVMAAGVALQSVSLGFPDTVRSWLTDKETHFIALFLLIVGVMGRLVGQPSTKD